MDSSATKPDQTTPADKQTAEWKCRAMCAAAAILGALTVAFLMMNVRFTQLPTRLSLTFAPLMARAGQWGAGLGSREVARDSSTLTAVTSDGTPVMLGAARLAEGVRSLPLLLLACMAASWIAARQMKLAWGSTTVLVALAAGLSALGLPVISGFLQGWGVAVEYPMKYVDPIGRMAMDAAPMMVCGLVALCWVVMDHIWVEEATRVPQADTAALGRPARLWAAAAAALVLAIFLLATSLGVTKFTGGAAADSPMGWRGIRHLAAAAVAVVAAVLLLMDLKRGQRARWAWVGLCVLVPLGGGAGGGVALLLAAVAARVPVVGGVVENGMPVKKMPVKKKRKYRL